MIATAETIYRDATINAKTRAKLELAYNVLVAIPGDSPLAKDLEIDLAGAVRAIRDTCDSWDRNDVTETVFP